MVASRPIRARVARIHLGRWNLLGSVTFIASLVAALIAALLLFAGGQSTSSAPPSATAASRWPNWKIGSGPPCPPAPAPNWRRWSPTCSLSGPQPGRPAGGRSSSP